MGTVTLTNHQSKSNGIINSNHLPPSGKLISSSRRIPRLVRSANVDDHNNNLVNDIASNKNGVNGTVNINGVNGKEIHTKMLSNSIQMENGEVNGNSTKLQRIRNSRNLKSPNFRTRVTSGDE